MRYTDLKKNKNGYRYYVKDGKKIFVHKRVAEKRYGKIPEGFIIHHIDKNKDHNWKENLMLIHRKDHWRIHTKKNLEIKTIK